MRNWKSTIAAVALAVLTVPAWGSVIADDGKVPAVQVSIEGFDGHTFTADVGERGDFNTTFQGNFSDVASFEGSFMGDTDPFINYSFGVSNFTAAPVTFTFVFSTPYAGGPFNSLFSSHSSSITDGGATPDGNVTISTAGIFTAIHNPDVDGTFPIGAALGVGCNVTMAAGFSTACDASTMSTTAFGPSAVAGTFSITVKFTVSPHDLYSANGRADLLNVKVPAPGVLGLLGMGLAGVGLLRRRKSV